MLGASLSIAPLRVSAWRWTTEDRWRRRCWTCWDVSRKRLRVPTQAKSSVPHPWKKPPSLPATSRHRWRAKRTMGMGGTRTGLATTPGDDEGGDMEMPEAACDDCGPLRDRPASASEEAQKELNSSRAEIDKLTKANAEVQAKLKAAQSDSENVKKQAERQQAASKVALDQLQADALEQERLAQELASTKASLSKTQSQASETEKILQAREKALQEGSKVIASLKAEIEKLKVDAQAAAAELEKSTQSAAAEAAKQKNNLAAIQKQKEAAEKELTAIKQTNAAVDAQLKDTQHRLQEATACAESQNKQLLHLQAELKKCARHLADQEAITEDITRVNSRLTQENARLQEQVENMRHQESALQEKVRRLTFEGPGQAYLRYKVPINYINYAYYFEQKAKMNEQERSWLQANQELAERQKLQHELDMLHEANHALEKKNEDLEASAFRARTALRDVEAETGMEMKRTRERERENARDRQREREREKQRQEEKERLFQEEKRRIEAECEKKCRELTEQYARDRQEAEQKNTALIEQMSTLNSYMANLKQSLGTSLPNYSKKVQENRSEFLTCVQNLAKVKTPKWSIGLVGRTSAGKSSLLNRMFGTTCKVGATRCTAGVEEVYEYPGISVWDVFGFNDEEASSIDMYNNDVGKKFMK